MAKNEIKNKIYDFLRVWTELKNNEIEIVFEDGSTFLVGDDIELVWNVDNSCVCFNSDSD